MLGNEISGKMKYFFSSTLHYEPLTSDFYIAFTDSMNFLEWISKKLAHGIPFFLLSFFLPSTCHFIWVNVSSIWDQLNIKALVVIFLLMTLILKVWSMYWQHLHSSINFNSESVRNGNSCALPWTVSVCGYKSLNHPPDNSSGY